MKLHFVHLQCRISQGKKEKKQKLRGNPADAKAYAEVGVRSVVVFKIRNSAVAGGAVPATAAKHTEDTAYRTCRIGKRTTGIGPPYIPYPIPNIAAHIIKT